MDWVAMFFFDAWAGQVGLPYGLTRLHGRQMWDERSGGTWKYSGRLAVDALVEWLVHNYSMRRNTTAEVLASKFALAVNVVDAPLPAKDVLASRMVNIRKDRRLQDGIRAWRDAGEPAANLLALV
jgi:rhodanese-related sulfurtransferase